MSNFIREYLKRIDQLQIDIAENETFTDKNRELIILHVMKELAIVYCLLESCLPEHQTTPFPKGEGARWVHRIKNNAPVSFLEAPRGLLKWVEDRLHDRKT